MSIFDLFTERKSNSTNNRHHSQFNRNVVRSRNLRLESLEERALLSAVPLSTSEYADLRAQYADFNLPENMADLNVITLDLAQGDNLTSLKSAIAAAGQTPKSDLIVMRTTNTTDKLAYTDSTDQLIINIDASLSGSVTIIGLGPQKLTLDANQKCRVMTISSSATNVNLGGLTISGGKITGSSGGGLYNAGTLTIMNSALSGNTISYGYEAYGGGIYNSGTLTFTNSTLSGNTVSCSNARPYGGGIYNSGVLTVTNSTLSGNTASSSTSSIYSHAYGGGIYNTGKVTVTRSTLSGNTVSSSTESNTSNAYGGGIYNSGTLTFANSTLSGNTASSSISSLNYYNDAYSNSYGGGLYNSGRITVTNSTISGNTAPCSITTGNAYCNRSYSSFKGIYHNTSLPIWFNNSIIVDSIHKNAGNIYGSNNLSTYTDWSAGTNNLTYDSDKPLFVNAGNSDFHLIAGSQAIDMGDNALAEELTYDKDGIIRVVNGTVDIGAYEYHTSKFASPDLAQPTASGPMVAVSWASVDNAVAYQLEYKRSEDSTWTTQTVEGTSATFIGLRDLIYNIRVKVLGLDYCADSDYSQIVDVEVLNRVPTAVDDTLVLNGQNVYILDVLANDSDQDGDPLFVVSITQPTYGQAALFADGRIFYLPVGNVTSDSFTYTIQDGFGGTSTATVTITGSGDDPINPEENEQPVAQDDSVSVNQNGYVLIDVLANDSDPDGDTLTILSTTQPANGAVIISKDDKILYICNGHPLADSFTYTVSDGRGGTSTSTVTIAAPPASLAGLTLSTDSPVVGSEITTTLDPVDATVTYQWYRGTTLLEDETGSSFIVTMDEVGQTITCVVTGTGDFTGTASATTNVVPPKALDTPDAPTLTAIETNITASWTGDENASSYTLQYQIDGSEGWTTISDIEGTSTFFVGIAGATYNVKIQANGTGNYANSDFSEVSSITLAAPLNGLTLSTDTPKVGTEITAILSPAGATATYQWFAGETPIEGAESSSFVVTEAQIGQTITCVVTGTGNFYGTVSASTAMIPVPVAQLDVPTNFGVSVYNADVTASWSAVENASSYTLEYKPVDGDFWTSMLEIQGTTATFVGVSGTVYNVRVRANGTGDFADSDYAATITDKATGPVVAINVNKIMVSWVDESPEADAVRYRVAGTEKWTLKKLKAGVTSLTFNAAIGTNYDVEVLLDQQETNVLRGTAVVLDQAKLAAVKPSITDDSFQINVTNYAAKNLVPNAKQAILTINGTMTTLDIVNQQGSAVLPGGGNVTFENGQFSFTGMASNSQYKVLVSFSDGHSVSKVSGAVSVKTLKAPYLAPVLTSAVAVSDTSIEVTWETSYGKNSTTPAQKYTVQYSTDGVKWTNATTAAIGTSFTIQKLKGGNNYQVRVLATKDNAFEASAPSAVMTAETLATPTVVLDKTSVTDEAFQMNVTNYQITNLVDATTMNIVTDQFGAAAIELQNKAGSVAFANGMTATFDNGALMFTNVPSNTALKVQISFTKADCTTNLSTALAVKTTMASYNKPVLISAIATSTTTVEVAWETVYGKNSTTAAQKYTVQYSLDGSRWTNATTAATGTSFTIQNLKPKTKYLIAVIATKDQWFNASEPSDSLLVTTLG